jgi:hypothetical protein
MNDLQLEQLFRRAPTPPAPVGLKEQLKTGIRLAAPTSERIATATPLWRRWFPALSFSLLLLGCLLALAMQTTQLGELRRENAALRTATADIEQLRRDNAELENLRTAAGNVERAKNEHNELLKLRGEVRQLRTATQELSNLRAENKRLQALAASVTAAPPATTPGATLSGAPIVRFSETNWDFGQVISTEPQSHVFIVANVGNAPLEILEVRTSCGCTTAGEWDRRVEPGKTGVIPIVFNPSKFTGPVNKWVTVTSNDPDRPVQKLLIQAEISRPNEAQP